jgi:hypothetical protein
VDDFIQSSVVQFVVVSGAECVHVGVAFLSLFGARLRGVEVVYEEGETLVDVCRLEVGEFLGDRFGGFDLEGDFYEFVLLGGEGKGLGLEGELFDIVETEEEIVEWGCGVVGDFDSLGGFAVELNDFGVDCD